MNRRGIGPLLVGALLVGACQVPTNDNPQPIAADGVPYRLLGTTTTTTTTIVAAPIEVKRDLYLVRRVDPGNRLVLVERSFEAGTSDLREVLRVLLSDQASRTEEEQGLSSAIPEGAEFLGLEIDEEGRIATVQVSGIFEELQGDGVRLALAQIVFTVTNPIDEITGVRFRNRAGEVVEALIDGNESASVVNRSDYRSLSPS